MTDQVNPPSRPWRRLLRFSVRGMIVVVLVVGSWLGWIVRSARIQREAVAAIEHDHGFVYYDCDWKDGEPVRRRARSWYLKWFANHVDLDYFSNVVSVIFSEGPSDAKLALLSGLYRLEELRFDSSIDDRWNSSLTDTGLAHLEGHTRLKGLDLSDTNITDAGLVHLRGLTGLQELDLSGTPVTDAGLVHLENLTRLEKLDLRSTDISNAGAVHLRKLTNLRSLDVYDTKVDDFGVGGRSTRCAQGENQFSGDHRSVVRIASVWD
jgi:Leucine Rich repeats (2 copies)